MSITTRRTKIVCTIGPAVSSPEQLRELMKAGMDVARLNFSHGDHESHRRVVRTIRRLSEEMGKETGILQDLRGPKIRVGQLPDAGMKLEVDETVDLVPHEESTFEPIAHSGLYGQRSDGSRIGFGGEGGLCRPFFRPPRARSCTGD